MNIETHQVAEDESGRIHMVWLSHLEKAINLLKITYLLPPPPPTHTHIHKVIHLFTRTLLLYLHVPLSASNFS